MPTPVTDPALLAELNGGRAPVSDPALLAQLNGEPTGPQFRLSAAITGIPREIGATAERNLSAIEQGLSNRAEKGSIEGLLGTGKAVLGGLGLVASPITGAARSLIGRPSAYLQHKVGELINPAVAAQDDPEKMYEAAAGDAETALMAGRAGVPKPPVVAAPTVAELKAASRAGYRAPEVAAVEINPQSTANLSAKIESDLAALGYRNRASSPEKAVFEEVRGLIPPQGVQSVKVADLHSAQKAFGIMARERDAVGAPTPKAAAASVAKQHLDDYLPNIATSDVLAGDAAAASEILAEAAKNWGAAKRAEQVDLQLTRAERQAAKSGMGGNAENAMRQKIATILDNPKRSSGYSAAEIQAMEDIVRGTRSRNALRAVGKLGVDGGLSLLLNTGAAIGSGGATIPVTMAGTLARVLGQRATSKAGVGLSEMVRSRSPLATNAKGIAAVQQALMARNPTAAAIPYAGVQLSPAQLKRTQIAQLLAQL